MITYYSGSRHGWWGGSDVRLLQWQNAAQPAGRWERSAWRRPRSHLASSIGTPGAAHRPVDTDRPQRACTASTAAGKRGAPATSRAGVFRGVQVRFSLI
jgi:hypothetical protein